MTLKELADKLGCELNGPQDKEIEAVAGIESAGENELTFLSNKKYIRKLKDSKAGAVIVGQDSPETDIPTLVSANPYLAFARAIELFYAPPRQIPGIHPTAWVSETAVLGEDCSIGANVVIGDHVVIGNRAVVHPNSTIYSFAQIGDDFYAHSNVSVREHVRIGHRVVLQNGAVIGGDGFGFAPREDGSYYKIVQSGTVVLEDDVEVGANTCIDRATVGESRIGKGTKLDNLVQIGHGTLVGSHNVVAAQVGLAGSTKVGNHVMLAGQVGVAGHLTINDRVIATAQTGIARDVPEGTVVSGSPEMDSAVWKKNYIILQKLPDLAKEVRNLRQEIEALKSAGK